MKLIILFTALTVFNVIIQTVKSLCTVRCSTFTSACVNALAYGLYTYVIFFTTSEGMPLWSKAVITAVANFFGVYVANYIFDDLYPADELEGYQVFKREWQPEFAPADDSIFRRC